MLVVVFVSLLVAGALAQSPGTAPGVVWVIPVEGTIEPGLSEFVLRALRDARQAGAALILLEINSFGGRVDAATEIRDAIFASPVPTAAFVADRAISAGALIALATERIVMKPGATFGAAQPQPLDEKTLSYVRAEFEATAEGRGRDPLIAAAMVDASVVVEGLSGPGQILTLTAASALARGYADFAQRGLRGAELLGNLRAVAVVVEHLLNAAQLPLYTAQPALQLITRGRGFQFHSAIKLERGMFFPRPGGRVEQPLLQQRQAHGPPNTHLLR